MVVPTRLRQCGSGYHLPGGVVRQVRCTPLGATPRVVPHNFMDLSILLFVISIASYAHEIVHRDNGKVVTIGKAA